MLYWTAVFFVIALIAAVFGFGGVAAASAEISTPHRYPEKGRNGHSVVLECNPASSWQWLKPRGQTP